MHPIVAHSSPRTIRFLLPLLCLLLVTACGEERGRSAPQVLHCSDCHSVDLDQNHRLACTACHQGNNEASGKESAHRQLVARPAHPEAMQTACGPCHGAEVAQVAQSAHFTLEKTINGFRQVFGSRELLANLHQVPTAENPENVLELADDLLRRNCFSCHPATAGEDYPNVTHGVGCGACHLPFVDGKLKSHTFQKPQDPQCLGCHYGNTVGFDYYGRFEHDYSVEYRTPYTTREAHFRPYGVEYHQLVPDIHQQKGLICRDCHAGAELMGKSAAKPSCAGCHERSSLAQALPPRVEKQGDSLMLKASDGREHILPLLRHPAHFEFNAISCQACHAQWTFNDFGKHFLRYDGDDLDPWTLLASQGSAEVEGLIERSAVPGHTEPLTLTDKLSGKAQPGIWLKGFTMRRWEEPLLGRDANGAITTVRPLLDYFLSWVDSDDKIRFNSISATDDRGGLRPYVPHTTGPAGIFYRKRIDFFLERERKPASQ